MNVGPLRVHVVGDRGSFGVTSATTLAEAMREAGMEVTFLAREGDHGISSPELEALGTWLEALQRFAR